MMSDDFRVTVLEGWWQSIKAMQAYGLDDDTVAKVREMAPLWVRWSGRHVIATGPNLPTATAQEKTPMWGQKGVTFVRQAGAATARTIWGLYMNQIRAALASDGWNPDTMEPVAMFLVLMWRDHRLEKGESRTKATRPDADNVAKELFDCMEKAGIVRNDARINPCIVRIETSGRPGLFLAIAQDTEIGNVMRTVEDEMEAVVPETREIVFGGMSAAVLNAD